ncbi:MAG: ATP phosphoribosyltransferase [Bacteroidia bacterium]|nr:ATP phosphoribosyltransferase [Bacteroidia bacterium]
MNHENNIFKLAIQKSGRLTEDSLRLLGESGIKIRFGDRALRAVVEGLPMEILFLRDDDIPEYVENGVAHAGIVGLNTLEEKGNPVDILCPLDFGHCRLSLAIPKEQTYDSPEFFRNKKIATSYPNILEKFFKEKNIPVKIEKIRGSVEISVSLGLADGIFDIVSTGSTLLMNGLKEAECVMKSYAVLVGCKNLNKEIKKMATDLVFRIQSVMNAQKNRYIMLNCPTEKVKTISKILPGVKSPTVLPLAMEGWCSLHSVIPEKDFWPLLSRLKEEGAQGILVIPIEKMVI